jgi:acyl carrier protein
MRIEEIVGRVFNVDPRELNELSSRDTVDGWDSMGHLSLILELERRLGVSLAIADAMEMVDVATIKAILRRYGIGC